MAAETMPAAVSIVLLDDNPADAELIARDIRRNFAHVSLHMTDSRRSFIQALRACSPELILSDYALPGFTGLEALEIARLECPGVPVIFVSGTIGEERAIEILRSGAVDYVLKDNRKRLPTAIERAIAEARERRLRQLAEADLERSEQRFRLFMDYLPGLAYIKDASGRFSFVNRETEKVFGLPHAELLGRRIEEALDARLAAQQLATEAAARENGGETISELDTPLGRRAFLFKKFHIPDTQPGKTSIASISIDVTERITEQLKLVRLARMHRMLSGMTSMFLRVRNRDELLQEACRIAVEAGEFRMGWIGLYEARSGQIRPLAHFGHVDGYLDMLNSRMRQPQLLLGSLPLELDRSHQPVVVNDITLDERIADPNAALVRGYRSLAVLPLLTHGQLIGGITLYSAENDFFDQAEVRLLRELTADIAFALENIEKTEQLSYAHYYDVLTGLPNRRLLFDRLSRHVEIAREGDQFAIAVMDIDGFHHINESLGRDAGDLVLQEFGRQLTERFPNAETHARVSGDGFALVADVESAADIAQVLSHWASDLSSHAILPGAVDLHLSFRAGLALYPGDGRNAESLFHNAETALQNAKDTRQPLGFYQADMNSRVAERLQLESQLHQALHNQEFVLYYQPQVDLRSRQICGLEALIRWRCPQRGLVSPGDFIPLLERTGRIVEVGHWALQQAVADLRHWRELGLPTPRVAVNVSQLQLTAADFVEHVLAALGDERAIDLEITESLMMRDTERSVSKLSTLRAMGIGVKLDDFGIGYSSLSQLARLPIDTLKIDQSFIARMCDETDAMTIVSTIVGLARALRMGVIAEGVETEEQARMLSLLGCEQAQGFLYSRPVPPETLPELLHQPTLGA